MNKRLIYYNIKLKIPARKLINYEKVGIPIDINKSIYSLF